MSGSDTTAPAAATKTATATIAHHRTFLSCPHKGSTTGAQYRPGLGFIRCAACYAARVADKETT